MRRGTFYVIAALVVLLDRLTKMWAARTLADGHIVAIIPDYLVLSFVRNRGSAFGLFQGGAVPLAIVAVIAIGFMVWAERRGLPGRVLPVAVGLQLGGALGNLIDRVHLGYVIDFIELDWRGRNIWPVFNVADSAITIGTILLILWLWRSEGTKRDARSDA